MRVPKAITTMRAKSPVASRRLRRSVRRTCTSSTGDNCRVGGCSKSMEVMGSLARSEVTTFWDHALGGAAAHRRYAAAHVKAIYMSWSKDDRGPRGYHHGNLKEALLRAALELIAQKGPAGFTFAEAARWAGVSPASPYRHFRDRDELLIDVARRGFDKFEVALARACDGGRPAAFSA